MIKRSPNLESGLVFCFSLNNAFDSWKQRNATWLKDKSAEMHERITRQEKKPGAAQQRNEKQMAIHRRPDPFACLAPTSYEDAEAQIIYMTLPIDILTENRNPSSIMWETDTRKPKHRWIFACIDFHIDICVHIGMYARIYA